MSKIIDTGKALIGLGVEVIKVCLAVVAIAAIVGVLVVIVKTIY